MNAALSLFAVLALAVSALARAPLHLAKPELLIKDSYIVVLHNNVSSDLKSYHINRFTATSSSTFSVFAVWDIINGYAATISSKSDLEALLADPLVDFVEEDQVVKVDYKQEKPHDFHKGGQSPAPTPALDSVASRGSLASGLWGLARVWQGASHPITNEFRFWASAGEDTDAYIVDTGINTAHTQFQNAAGASRIKGGTSFISNEATIADGNGHGTHVASTIGGLTYGLANKVNIWAVKVLSASGSGSNAGVVSGINWVATNYQSQKRPSVANLSLGGGASTATDNAVANTVAAGVTMVVAAGNDNANACNYSPARATAAWTVGSITNTDARSSFSNFGTCVNVFAPGSSILGAWIGSATATNTISGTSMASPHAAGVVALYNGHLLPATNTPAQVKAALDSRATSNVVTNPGTGSPNKLAFASTTA